jgi:hypothetical protein
MDFVDSIPIKPSHRPTRLTGEMNIKGYESLKRAGRLGLTREELAKEHGWSETHAVMAELRALYLVRKTEARRNNKVVYVVCEDAL